MSVQGEAVLETDLQRLHERVDLPACAEISDHRYSIYNISKGGLCISGLKSAPNENLTLKLLLSFDDFNFDMTLDAEPRHFNENSGLLGLRFTEDNQRKLSFLASIIRSYKSGHYLRGEDIDRLTHARPLYLEPPAKPMGKAKKSLIAAFIFTLTIMAAFLLSSNIYQALFVIKSPSAFVATQQIEIRAAHSGLFQSLLQPGQNSIRKGEPLGRVGITPLLSPCDCLISQIKSVNGQDVLHNAALFVLTPLEPSPHIEASVTQEDAQRLRLKIPADIRIPGTGIVTKAEIKTLTRNSDSTILARLEPLSPIPANLTGSPVKVSFNLR